MMLFVYLLTSTKVLHHVSQAINLLQYSSLAIVRHSNVVRPGVFTPLFAYEQKKNGESNIFVKYNNGMLFTFDSNQTELNRTAYRHLKTNFDSNESIHQLKLSSHQSKPSINMFDVHPLYCQQLF